MGIKISSYRKSNDVIRGYIILSMYLHTSITYCVYFYKKVPKEVSIPKCAIKSKWVKTACCVNNLGINEKLCYRVIEQLCRQIFVLF